MGSFPGNPPGLELHMKMRVRGGGGGGFGLCGGGALQVHEES